MESKGFTKTASLFLAGLLAVASGAWADGGVSFTDLAVQEGSGLAYQRAPSPRKAIFDALKQQPVYSFPADFAATPLKARGAPGVALLDFDRDGDLDIYVTNGPGAANSLFSSQLVESGEVRFVDVGVRAGVGAEDQDSQGTCFGDIDNDGDHDLLVLGNAEPNRLFENRGDGTFADITAASGVGGGASNSTSCSMGDVDGDGLLDIAVANAYDDWSHQLPYFGGEPFQHNQHNQLFRNAGGNVFTDVSDTSGIRELAGLAPELSGIALLTWAIALVDLDLDGDVDLLTADDQTVTVPVPLGGIDIGFIRFFENDGGGHFTDRTFDVGLDRFGAWMGLAFGDLDCNRQLDIFGTNFGDYTPATLGFPVSAGEWSSRWLLRRRNGTFTDPGVGDLVSLPFGWGGAIVDYDNDSDLDIVFHGGFDINAFVDASNPGVFLENQDCSGKFALDTAALAGSTDHSRRADRKSVV